MLLSSSHPAAALLAAVLAEHGVRHAVVSPGSRNAPLILALHHHPDIEVRVSIDERSAAYHALGLALATWTPVPVICTSGTAALNHGPALAEAFHARVPLLSITADRPADVIGRGHGQTIVQSGVHALHTLHHDVLDESQMDEKTMTEKIRHALEMAMHGGPGRCSGPVHLNVPLHEPLYDLDTAPKVQQTSTQTNSTDEHGEGRRGIPEELQKVIHRGKVLVVAGPRPPSASSDMVEPLRIDLPCLAERGANVSGPLVVFGGERLLEGDKFPQSLQPEAIITLGLPPMSKALRSALGGVPHWHVGADLPHEGTGWDVWGTLKGDASVHLLLTDFGTEPFQQWQKVSASLQSLNEAFHPDWSDLAAWRTMAAFWENLDTNSRPRALHLANSATARYAQWINLEKALHPKAVVYANRGVAGIDGCTSTAIGWHAEMRRIHSNHCTWLVTGDLAFHYDANAFMTDPKPQGLKIIVINNGGGGIFSWLPGVKHQDMFERCFETPPQRSVRELATLINAEHHEANNSDELHAALHHSNQPTNNVVVEVVTSAAQSSHQRNLYLQSFREKV